MSGETIQAMQSRLIATLGAFSLLAVLVSCSATKQVRESLTALRQLESEAPNKFPQQQITFNITTRANGTFLTVRFVNSPWNELPAAEKQAKALETARWAYATYISREKLANVTVVFGTHSSYGGVLDVQSSSGAFQFPAQQLAADGDARRQN